MNLPIGKLFFILKPTNTVAVRNYAAAMNENIDFAFFFYTLHAVQHGIGDLHQLIAWRKITAFFAVTDRIKVIMRQEPLVPTDLTLVKETLAILKTMLRRDEKTRKVIFGALRILTESVKKTLPLMKVQERGREKARAAGKPSVGE